MSAAFDDLVKELAHATALPKDALQALVPHAAALFERIKLLGEILVAGDYLTPSEEQLLLLGLHVLASSAHAPAWGLWLDLLGAPDGAKEGLFGDGSNFAITRITLGLAAGLDQHTDFAPLAAMIEGPDTDGSTRWSLLEVLARLVAEGRFERSRLIDLADWVAGQSWEDEANLWAVDHVIALAGLAERREALDRLWTLPAFDHFSEADRKETLERLAVAEQRRDDPAYFDEEDIKAFPDPVASLHWLAAIEASHGPDPSEKFALNWREREDFAALLARADNPPETMSFEEMDGFFHALVLGPTLIMPSTYLKTLWSDGPVFDDLAHMQGVMTLIQSHWNAIAAIRTSDLDFRPYTERAADSAHGARWAQGFMKGVGLAADAWTPARTALETMDAMAEIEWLIEGERLDPADRTYILNTLPESLRGIADFWRDAEVAPTRRGLGAGGRPGDPGLVPIGALRGGFAHKPARSAKIGRNAQCPCGSGKKWKKCCGGAGGGAGGGRLH